MHFASIATSPPDVGGINACTAVARSLAIARQASDRAA